MSWELIGDQEIGGREEFDFEEEAMERALECAILRIPIKEIQYNGKVVYNEAALCAELKRRKPDLIC